MNATQMYRISNYHRTIAHEVVKKFKTADTPYEDMYQEALIGIWQSMMKAKDKGEFPSTMYMKLRGQDRVKRLLAKNQRVYDNEIVGLTIGEAGAESKEV